MADPKVIISNGHFKFILAPLAAEVARHGMLALFLTGAYPGPRILRRFRTRPFGPKGFRRFVAREEPGIPPELVRAKTLSELLVQFGVAVRKVTGSTPLGQRFEILGMRQYGGSAAGDVRTAAASIYHYRSGYGHASVAVAKARGMITICDHSLPNPEVMDGLVTNDGRWPDRVPEAGLSPWARVMLPDLRAADYLVVNSDFVKESFVRYGWTAHRIFVHYTGVDNDFMQALPSARAPRAPIPQLLFAGELSRRKGTHVLAAALRRLTGLDFRIDLIGDIHEDVAADVAQLKTDPRVRHRGFLPRRQLALEMSAADIFVFPSLAEGSARVVFMALAAGCYVITTLNSGSIVRAPEHGAVVPAGDVGALAEAIASVVRRRDDAAAIGAANAALIRSDYPQAAYGRQTRTLYQNLVAQA